jgi:hypothetical protein
MPLTITASISGFGFAPSINLSNKNLDMYYLANTLVTSTPPNSLTINITSDEPIMGLIFYFLHRPVAEHEAFFLMSDDPTLYQTTAQPFQYFPLLNPSTSVQLTVLASRFCATKILCLRPDDWQANLSYLSNLQTMVSATLTNFWNNIDTGIAAFTPTDLVQKMKNAYNNQTKYPLARTIFTSSDPSTIISSYRAFFNDKFITATMHGMHPFFMNIAVPSNVVFYTSFKRADLTNVQSLMSNQFNLAPTFYLGSRVHNFTVQNIAGLLEQAMQTFDLQYIYKWNEYMYKWLFYTPDIPWDNVQNQEVNFIQDFFYLFKYWGTLCLFFPTLWNAIPTDLIVRIILKIVSIHLPMFLRYYRNNAQNWRSGVAPTLFCFAVLLDEWIVGRYCFYEAIRDIQDYLVNVLLTDGTQIEKEVSYNYMFFNVVQCRELIAYRKYASYYLPDDEIQIYNTGTIETTLHQAALKVSTFLVAHIQYNKQYPAGARHDNRDETKGYFTVSMNQPSSATWIPDALLKCCAGAPVQAGVPMNSNSSNLSSVSFPCGGFNYSKTFNSYVYFFNSPHPAAGGAFRSKSGNNLLTFSIGGQDILIGNEIGIYQQVTTPVSVIDNTTNKEYLQNFAYGVFFDTSTGVGHKGYLVNAINDGKTNVITNYNPTFDYVCGIYNSYFQAVDGTLRTDLYHIRSYYYDKVAGILIIHDLVPDTMNGTQYLWMPSPLKPTLSANNQVSLSGYNMYFINSNSTQLIPMNDIPQPYLLYPRTRINTTFTKELYTILLPSTISNPDLSIYQNLIAQFDTIYLQNLILGTNNSITNNTTTNNLKSDTIISIPYIIRTYGPLNLFMKSGSNISYYTWSQNGSWRDLCSVAYGTKIFSDLVLLPNTTSNLPTTYPYLIYTSFVKTFTAGQYSITIPPEYIHMLNYLTYELTIKINGLFAYLDLINNCITVSFTGGIYQIEVFQVVGSGTTTFFDLGLNQVK